MNIIDDINYATDHRVRALERDDFTIEIEQPDGSYLEETLPTRWIVCPTCNGEGTHVDPSIDAGGLSADDFSADPDFAEDYVSGVYDVPCYGCDGRSTVRAVDLDACTPEQRDAWESYQRARAEWRAMEYAEMRAGC